MSINLIATGFYIPDSVQWLLAAGGPVMNLEIRTGQEIGAECHGHCGGCVPSSDGTLTYRTIEGQTIEIRYDPNIDSTACTPDWAVDFAP